MEHLSKSNWRSSHDNHFLPQLHSNAKTCIKNNAEGEGEATQDPQGGAVRQGHPLTAANACSDQA